MLLQQEDGLRNSTNATTEVELRAPMATLARTNLRAKPDDVVQGSLDFGIEPVRAAKSA